MYKCLNKLFILLFILQSSAYALSIEKYESMKMSSAENLKIYITGLGEGMSWSSNYITGRKNKAIYCPPPRIPLNADNYINIIDTQIKNENDKEAPVELLLLMGLIDSFPCK